MLAALRVLHVDPRLVPGATAT